MDPNALVAAAYDQIAEEYLRRFGTSAVKARWAEELIRRAQPPGHIVDLGCGAGVPLARRLVDEGFDVTGVDGSARQIELARHLVPEARFIHADMTAASFPAAQLAGVTAFYSLNHLPRSLYPRLLRAIYDWLRPGGVFVGNFGAADEAGWTGDWLGAETFFSGHEPRVVAELLAHAGFETEISAIDADEGDETDFLWVVARKSATGARG